MRAGIDACPISQNPWFTQCFALIGSLGDPDMPENPLNCESQNGKAKSRKAQLVAQIARVVRKAGLDYDGWRYVAKRVQEGL